AHPADILTIPSRPTSHIFSAKPNNKILTMSSRYPALVAFWLLLANEHKRRRRISKITKTRAVHDLALQPNGRRSAPVQIQRVAATHLQQIIRKLIQRHTHRQPFLPA